MEPTLLEFYGRAYLKQTSWSPLYSSFMDARNCNKLHEAHITRVLWTRPSETNVIEPSLLEFYGCTQLQQTSLEPTLLEFYRRAHLKQTSCSPHYSSFIDAPA